MSVAPVDVAIAGAGIVGAACADAFTEAGLSVAVIEPGIIGGGATAQGMGHIEAMDDSEAQFILSRYSRELWRELAPKFPAAVEYTNCGTLWVAADEEELATAKGKCEYFMARGMRAELLDETALREAEPRLRQGLAGGALVPGGSVVYAPAAAKWLLERAADRGMKLITGVAVKRFGDSRAELSDDSAITAGKMVNATGAWCPELNPELPVTPKKGHLAITDRYPGFAHSQLIELGYLKSAHGGEKESVAFNVQPRPTGQLLVGSSRQMGESSSKVEPAMLSRMLRRAIEYMPRLAELSVIRAWTGVRAATPDNLPLIGPHPDRDDLYLATGHEGLGITTALGTARLLADQLLGRTTAIPAEPYLPGRAIRG